MFRNIKGFKMTNIFDILLTIFTHKYLYFINIFSDISLLNIINDSYKKRPYAKAIYKYCSIYKYLQVIKYFPLLLCIVLLPKYTRCLFLKPTVLRDLCSLDY